jgi:Fe-S-cluster containining protein
MNTMIHEHEAIRLAEVTGRAMTRLPYRPQHAVYVLGDRFNGKPCPFLVEHRCTVYEDRPMVCRTHHSLNADASACKTAETAGLQIRPAMYDPDFLEEPYMELNAAHNPTEPWGNIAEFFPD